jgi:hypothetical protein
MAQGGVEVPILRRDRRPTECDEILLELDSPGTNRVARTLAVNSDESMLPSAGLMTSKKAQNIDLIETLALDGRFLATISKEA